MVQTIVENISGLNDGQEGTHIQENNRNLSIQNQIGNLFILNLFLWQHFPVSCNCLLSVVNWFASSIFNFLVKHRLQHFCPGL